MNKLDILIVMLWLVLVLGLGMWAGFGSTLEGFWANRRKTGTALLVYTIVATQVGGGTIMGICSSTYVAGTGFGLVAVISTFTGFLCVALIAPWAKRFGDRNRAYTLPEVFGRRYGRSAQICAAALILVAYLSLLAGQFLALAVMLHAWTGLSVAMALVLAAGGGIVYSAFAGLRGDVVTDVLHFWLMFLILALLLVPVLGGGASISAVLSSVDHRIWSPLTFGGPVYLIAGVLLGAVIPVVSMEMWVRVYAANDVKTAKRAFVWSAIAVIPFYLIPMFIGLISSKTVHAVGNPDSLLVDLLFEHLPHGLLGLAIAGLFSVIISTANTMILVLGAVVYRDILGRVGKNEEREIFLSRVTTLVLGIVGLIFAMVVPSIVQLVLNAFFIIAVLAPALIGVAIWRKATAKGAIWSLVGGGSVTIACLKSMPTQAFVPGIVVALVLFFGISLLTKHSPNEDLQM